MVLSFVLFFFSLQYEITVQTKILIREPVYKKKKQFAFDLLSQAASMGHVLCCKLTWLFWLR